MDEKPPGLTLFLHEDTLARTLAYEQDLQRWRIAELEAGRGDPGRPSYDEVSGGLHSFGVMPHQDFRHLMVRQSHDIATTPRTALGFWAGEKATALSVIMKPRIALVSITHLARIRSLSSIPSFLYHSHFSTAFLAWPESRHSVCSNNNSLQWVLRSQGCGGGIHRPT